MRKAAGVLIAACLLAGLLVLPAWAAPADKLTVFKGTITKVEDGKFTAKDKDAKKVTFTVDDKTSISLDGKKAKLTDLKAEMEVSVTPTKGTAQTVIATSKK